MLHLGPIGTINSCWTYMYLSMRQALDRRSEYYYCEKVGTFDGDTRCMRFAVVSHSPDGHDGRASNGLITLPSTPHTLSLSLQRQA